MSVYLKLMHGRDHPDQQMNDWGFDGPVLGPFEAVHFTYTTHVRCFPKGSDGDAEAIELCFHDDMLVYEGKFYGDFEIAASFGSHTPKSKLPPELLEALQSILEHDQEFADIEDAETMVYRIKEKARVAIAKATG
jgi:hypothetical protein